MYCFDKANNRCGTSTTKWDRYESRYQLQDVIPLWVADMDFQCQDEITDSIIKRAKHGIFGYTDPYPEVYEAIIEWEKKHHQIEINQRDLVLTTGVVYAIYTLIELLVKPDEKVMVQTPVYPPFFNTPKSLHREVVENPLQYYDNTWAMDFDDLEVKLSQDKKIKLLILCNPHNPVGKSWQYEELERLCEICYRHHVWIVSDEIHSDLTLKPHRHCSIFTMPDQYHDHLIQLASPTKTFNLAGLKISYAIVKQEKLQHDLAVSAKASGLSSINIFGFEALVAAYRYGDQWLEECLTYIDHNFDYLHTYLQEHLPNAQFHKPDATYLAWIDLHKMILPEDYAHQLKYKGHVELQSGSDFGGNYHQWQRLNVACPKSTLQEGIQRMCDFLSKIELK